MAETRVQCPSCAAVLRLKAPSRAGAKLKCPKCQNVFAPQAAEDEYEEEYEDLPPPPPRSRNPARSGPGPKGKGSAGKKGKSGGGGVPLVLILSIVGVLAAIGIGVTLYFVLRKDDSKSPGSNQANSNTPNATPVANNSNPAGGGGASGANPGSNPSGRPSTPGKGQPIVNTETGAAGGNPSASAVPMIQAKFVIESKLAGGVSSLDVDREGKRLLAMGSGETKNVQLWDLEKREKIAEFDNMSGGILPVRFSPDGKQAAYAAEEFKRRIFLRDLPPGTAVHEVNDLPKGSNDFPDLGYVSGLSYSASGDLLVASSGSRLFAWNPKTQVFQGKWETGDGAAKSLSVFLAQDQKIASGSGSGKILVWDVASRKLEKALSGGHSKGVREVAANSTGTRIASHAMGDQIKLWDVAGGKVIQSIDAKGVGAMSANADFVCMTFLPGDRTLAYTIEDRRVYLRDVADGKLRAILQFDEKEDPGSSRMTTRMLWGLKASSDSKWVYVGSADGFIKAWEVPAGL